MALKLQDIFETWLSAHCSHEIGSSDATNPRYAKTFYEEKKEFLLELPILGPSKAYSLITEEKLEAHRASIEGSKLRLSQEHRFSSKKPLLFVLSDKLELFVSDDPNHTHASFFQGGPVAAAGEIHTDDEGNITKINTQSGHYRPGDEQTQNLIDFLNTSNFQPPEGFEFEVVVRDQFCKGRKTYLQIPKTLNEKHISTLEVRVQKIYNILFNYSEFGSHYKTVKESILPNPEFVKFKEKLKNSIEWAYAYETKGCRDFEEYAIRRFALISYASDHLEATVKDPKPKK